MRISDSVIYSSATNSMGNASKTYYDIINKITSGKNFTKISENPVDATKVLKLNGQLSKLDEYQSNIQAAINEMDLAWNTLKDVTDQLVSINDLIIEASNATTTPESAQAISTEIKERVNSIQDKMNTKYLDNYIFSGTFTQDRAYVVNDLGEIEYNGSSENAGGRNLTISEGTTFTYNFTGEQIFGKNDKDNGIKDFFAEMKELATLLEEPDLKYDEIREKITVIDKVHDNITTANGKISAKVAKLETTKEVNDKTILDLTENKVSLEEVDITKAATELASAQTALQASYTIGTSILGSVSLLDYL